MKARFLPFLVAVCVATPMLVAQTQPAAGKPKSWDWTGYYVLARTRALQGTGLKPVNEDLVFAYAGLRPIDWNYRRPGMVI